MVKTHFIEPWFTSDFDKLLLIPWSQFRCCLNYDRLSELPGDQNSWFFSLCFHRILFISIFRTSTLYFLRVWVYKYLVSFTQLWVLQLQWLSNLVQLVKGLAKEQVFMFNKCLLSKGVNEWMKITHNCDLIQNVECLLKDE